MESKNCTSCNLILTLDKFYRDRTPIHIISYRSKCISCCKLQQNKRNKNNKSDILSKTCSICNIKKIIDQFYKSYRHKDGYFKWCNTCHDHKSKNKENNCKIKRTSEYMIDYNKKRKAEIVYRLKYQIRSNLKSYLKNSNSIKKNSTIKYIGCTINFLKKWFEFNFDDKMSWINRGNYWHIDHINPCNSYNLLNQDEIYKCYNWMNLRPLEKFENIIKSNKIYNTIINEYEAKVKKFLGIIKYKITNNIYELLPEGESPSLKEESGELTGNP